MIDYLYCFLYVTSKSESNVLYHNLYIANEPQCYTNSKKDVNKEKQL